MQIPPKYRPLLIAGVGLLALPFVLLALGLTLTTATDVVIFAMACMGLNILVGHTGLVSFGHGALNPNLGSGANWNACWRTLNSVHGMAFRSINTLSRKNRIRSGIFRSA